MGMAANGWTTLEGFWTHLGRQWRNFTRGISAEPSAISLVAPPTSLVKWGANWAR